MSSPFKDTRAALEDVALTLARRVDERQKIVTALTAELADVQRQVAAYRNGQPLLPRALAAAAGVALGAAIPYLLVWLGR